MDLKVSARLIFLQTTRKAQTWQTVSKYAEACANRVDARGEWGVLKQIEWKCERKYLAKPRRALWPPLRVTPPSMRSVLSLSGSKAKS